MSWPAVLVEKCPSVHLITKVEHGFDLKGRVGHTDYIDFLTPNDLKEKSVVTGIDRFQRAFVSLKVEWRARTYVLTIFQRYTYDRTFWVHNDDGSALFDDITDGSSCMTRVKWQRLE